LNFFPLESARLHRGTGLEVLPTLEPDAALLAGRHLAHVFLEVLERVDPSFVDHLACPEKLDPASTADLALHDAAAGDDAGARDLDRDDDLNAAFTDLAVGGLAQTLGRALHVFGELVDHVVVADFDLRPFRGGGARRDVARRLDRALLDELGQGNLARRLLRTDDLEDVAGLGYLAHAGHDHRRRRRRFVHTLPAVIGQRAHAAVDVAANEVVAD